MRDASLESGLAAEVDILSCTETIYRQIGLVGRILFPKQDSHQEGLCICMQLSLSFPREKRKVESDRARLGNLKACHRSATPKSYGLPKSSRHPRPKALLGVGRCLLHLQVWLACSHTSALGGNLYRDFRTEGSLIY